MEAAGSCEMWVLSYQTAQPHILQDSTLHSDCCENLKSLMPRLWSNYLTFWCTNFLHFAGIVQPLMCCCMVLLYLFARSHARVQDFHCAN